MEKDKEMVSGDRLMDPPMKANGMKIREMEQEFIKIRRELTKEVLKTIKGMDREFITIQVNNNFMERGRMA